MNASRRPDVDWLRVGAVYLLFVFHVGKIFDPAPFYHVRNDDLSFAMLVVCGFIGLWHMPLLFLLAGWSAATSLRARGTRHFLAERVRKLFVPLVAGSVLLCPVIKYLELAGGQDLNRAGLAVAPSLQAGFRQVIPGGLPVAAPFHETFVEFLPTFFTRLDRFSWAHLWFLAYLLTFTLLYLPVLLRLLRGTRHLAAAGTWVVYAPLVLLVPIQIVLRPYWPGVQNLYDDWANFAYYTVYVVAGFLLACHPELDERVQAERTRSLVVALGAMGVLLAAVVTGTMAPSVLLGGSAVAGWCFVVALLGFARRWCTTGGVVLHWLSESAFPVYVLHQVAIVVLGSVVVRWPLGIAAKFTVLLLVSIALTLSVYQWAVRPFGITRFLLGMKPKPRPLGSPALTPSLVPAVAFVLALSSASAASTPVGLWYAEGGAAQVAIEPCGDGLCGRVVWLRSPLDDDGCDLRDRYNPDPALRGRPVVGLDVLHGLKARSERTWDDGSIYDPSTGHTYTCSLTLDGDDRVRLRGYLGIRLLGRTTTWTRVGTENQYCRADGR
jgi:uncharacterized protein (DUF2147 family)